MTTLAKLDYEYYENNKKFRFKRSVDGKVLVWWQE